MPRNSRERIEAFFDACGEDGEFARPPIDCPYSIVFPGADDSTGRVIYSTKPATVLAAMPETGLPGDCAVVARYGLPSERDGEFLASFTNGGHVSFLGDLDPPDLLIFAWLQEVLAPAPIEHLGVSDAIWRELGSPLPERFALPLTESERSAVALLEEVLPQLANIAGQSSAALLRFGRKIELESALAVDRESLTRLICGG